MDLLIKNRLALVTGASRGIGRSIAIALAKEGARVILVARSKEDWQKAWMFNLGISHEINRFFVPKMTSLGWGRIVHISTKATTNYSGYPAYVSAKCALNGYVKTMNRQVSKHNVIISAVSPGIIYIEGRHFAKLQNENPAALNEYFDHHVPIRRLGKTEEVAAAVAFLCSEQASFMAGSIVEVDGGGI